MFLGDFVNIRRGNDEMITMDDRGGNGGGRPLHLTMDDAHHSQAEIRVSGVGGGGGNAVNRMIAASVRGVQFLAVNTDCQDLKINRAPVKIQIGGKLTKGLGAGANPEIGRAAALEDTEKILEVLHEAD